MIINDSILISDTACFPCLARHRVAQLSGNRINKGRGREQCAGGRGCGGAGCARHPSTVQSTSYCVPARPRPSACRCACAAWQAGRFACQCASPARGAAAWAAPGRGQACCIPAPCPPPPPLALHISVLRALRGGGGLRVTSASALAAASAASCHSFCKPFRTASCMQPSMLQPWSAGQKSEACHGASHRASGPRCAHRATGSLLQLLLPRPPVT